VSAGLERRYRRLLSWYPAEHRRAYEDEMIGVMLAGARPGQRYPGWSEAVDVLRSAVRLRLRRLAPGLRDARWSDAAAVLSTLAPVLLLANAIRLPLAAYVLSRRLWAIPNQDPWPSRGTWLAILAWLAVTVTALVGWRRVAAAAAWVAVLGEVAMLGERYRTEPARVLSLLWLLVLSVTVATALSVRAAPRRALAVLGRRRSIGFAVACALLAASSTADSLTVHITRVGSTGMSVDPWVGGSYFPRLFWDNPPGMAAALAYLAVAVLILAAFVGIAAPVRRRLLALLAPATALTAVIALLFHGYAVSTVRFSSPVLLVPGQWTVLAVVPPVAFLVAVAVVHRRDRRLHLIALGRAVERQLNGAPPGEPDGNATDQNPEHG
jgi:hypothetical protein